MLANYTVADLDKLTVYLEQLSPHELAAAEASLAAEPDAKAWTPLPGPQFEAYHCEADELFYGGQAGGGKSDLGIGLALTEHHRSIIFRREATQLFGVNERLSALLGSREAYSGGDKVWRVPNVRGSTIELGSTPNPGDQLRYQGRPHDLIVVDEVSNFLQDQYQFISGWLRHEDPLQRCRVVATGNPPTTPEGLWVLQRWAPWLDPEHELYPCPPGALLWFTTIDGKDTLCPTGPLPFMHDGEMVQPRSRTFIPSAVDDNPFLRDSGYKAQLMSLPEPLRSQMLRGDFQAGQEDGAMQVIPTSWVKAAQDRWTEEPPPGPDGSPIPMDAYGVDCARGGGDNHVGTPRHGRWFGRQDVVPGREVPDGPTAAGRIVSQVRDGAEVLVDMDGIGGSVVDHLGHVLGNVTGIVNASTAPGTDRSGRLTFANQRARLWWKFREMLDPANTERVMLPPDAELRADLCAPTYKVTVRGILIEEKDLVRKRLMRSTDKGDSCVFASSDADSRALHSTLPRGERHDTRGYMRPESAKEQPAVTGWGSFTGRIEYTDQGIV